jgi:DNA-binding GntR family transcriptional regulator
MHLTPPNREAQGREAVAAQVALTIGLNRRGRPTSFMAEQPSPLSKQQIAYDYIKAAIEQGRFAPRQRLVIDSLARDLSISKVPVREAVRRLEAEGLVTFSANAGATVAGADIELWYQLVEQLALMEGYASASAAERITEEDLKRLRAINAGMAVALKNYDFPAWIEGNRLFHQTINAHCTNRSLIEYMATLHARTDAISRFVFPHSATILKALGPDGGRSALQAHEWLIAAFERREKPAVIEHHSRDHILKLAQLTRDMLEGKGHGTAKQQASIAVE